MTSAPCRQSESSQVYYIQYDKSTNLSTINVNLSLASMSLDSYSDLTFPTSSRDSLYNSSSLSKLFPSVLREGAINMFRGVGGCVNLASFDPKMHPPP